MLEEHQLKGMWKREGRGLTFEDYCIFVTRIGHIKYRSYNDAHWRDSDIMDKSDVWKALRNTEIVFQKAVTF